MAAKQEILNELARRIGQAKERSQHRLAEVYADCWHRVHSEADDEIVGLVRRIAARSATLPIGERGPQVVAFVNELYADAAVDAMRIRSAPATPYIGPEVEVIR